MSNEMQIKFQLRGQDYKVNFSEQDNNENAVLVGGRSYSVEGEKEAIDLVKSTLKELPDNSTKSLEQTGNDLKKRLSLAGAEKTEFSYYAAFLWRKTFPLIVLSGERTIPLKVRNLTPSLKSS